MLFHKNRYLWTFRHELRHKIHPNTQEAATRTQSQSLASEKSQALQLNFSCFACSEFYANPINSEYFL
jgi:hypothetical protein